MIQFQRIFFLLIVLFFSGEVWAYLPPAADSSTSIFISKRSAILRDINIEKKRIAHDYKTADSKFFNLLDSVSEFVMREDFLDEKKCLYLLRLQVFLQNIDRYYSESHFKAGAYFEVLSYYPTLIEWNQKGELLTNLKYFSDFSIKAIRLIPDSTIAEEFLSNYLSENPDDIFRHTEEFDDREFALSLLERALKFAPESAKRYFITENGVNDVLTESNDLFVKKAYEIFDLFGIKSHTYLLLDEIVNHGMSIEKAESISSDPDQLFHFLVRTSMVNGTEIAYSANRYIDNYCIGVIRKNNVDQSNSAYQEFALKRYTSEEIFALMCYGYKESNSENFKLLLETLKKESASYLVSAKFVTALDKEKLREFAIYCSSNQLLEELLSAIDESKRNYILSLTKVEGDKNTLPQLKTFEKENPIIKREKNLQSDNNAPIIALISDVTIPVVSKELPKSNPDKFAETTKCTASPTSITASLENTIIISPCRADYIPAPFSIPAPVEVVKITLDEKTRTTLAFKKNILQTIQNISSFIKQDYAEQLLNYAAQKEPDELFKRIDDFKNNRFSKNILEQCARNAPVSLKRYLYNPAHPVNYILQGSNDPIVQKIYAINSQLGSRSKPLLLLNDIMRRQLSVKDAIAISSEPGKLFHALVKIISQPDYIGKYNVDCEMRDYSLRFIREINEKIAIASTHQFNSVDDFSAADLYFLMLNGRDEVFTSTFNGLFERFIQKLPKDDGDAFFRSVNYNQFRDFLSLCSNFGTMDEFLARFSPDSRQKLLISYISNLETEKDDLSTVVLVAEAISNLNDYQLLSLLQNHIKQEYERVKEVNDPIGISIYGILSSMISGNAKVEMPWYKGVSEQFKISPVNLLSSSSLFNESKVCVQQMYFYNDDDGRNSFVNLMNTYRNKAAWVIEDRKSYIRIYSKEGMSVEVFANKPELEESGNNSIKLYFNEHKLSPSVIVHRGHSFYTETTLEKVPSSARLIFVGSCGGFYKVSKALENAPDAHIISTKQIGTKLINDAMLFALNENIRSKKDIVWNDFWEKMRLKLCNNQYFSDYIPPNKNLKAIFIRAYYKLLGV